MPHHRITIPLEIQMQISFIIFKYTETAQTYLIYTRKKLILNVYSDNVFCFLAPKKDLGEKLTQELHRWWSWPQSLDPAYSSTPYTSN